VPVSFLINLESWNDYFKLENLAPHFITSLTSTWFCNVYIVYWNILFFEVCSVHNFCRIFVWLWICAKSMEWLFQLWRLTSRRFLWLKGATCGLWRGIKFGDSAVDDQCWHSQSSRCVQSFNFLNLTFAFIYFSIARVGSWFTNHGLCLIALHWIHSHLILAKLASNYNLQGTLLLFNLDSITYRLRVLILESWVLWVENWKNLNVFWFLSLTRCEFLVCLWIKCLGAYCLRVLRVFVDRLFKNVWKLLLMLEHVI
jgi:hypothetical protein